MRELFELNEADLYDNLSSTYDLMISWKRRLRRERPFFTRIFKKFGVKRILDTACGTGMHAMAFNDWGYYVAGTDISAGMVAKSRENAGDRSIEFVQAGFTELDSVGGMFDAVTCLGNSLPHVLTDDALDKSLSSMFDVILPGGVLIIHSNNYDRILAQKERFMPLAQAKRDGVEYLFMRLFDFHDDLLTFNVITLKQQSGEWVMTPDSSTHRAITHDLLLSRLKAAGFSIASVYGGYPDTPYNKLESDNLIVVAQKPHDPWSNPIREPVAAIDRVPVKENGEPLVDVESVVTGILVKESPTFGRKTVVSMLAVAQSFLPDGYKLRIRNICRSMKRQREIYEQVYSELSENHPDWPESQLRRELNKFVAPPDAKHPPGHSTGGAVDLTIVGPDGQDLDMESIIGPDDVNRMKSFPTYSTVITPAAAKNRQMLVRIMTDAGFSNFPGEWWHWSYGDSAWAVRVDAPFAVYGATPELE